jgi:hypothetical protein
MTHDLCSYYDEEDEEEWNEIEVRSQHYSFLDSAPQYEFTTEMCPACGHIDSTQQRVTDACPPEKRGVSTLLCWKCGHIWPSDYDTGVSQDDFMNMIEVAEHWRSDKKMRGR